MTARTRVILFVSLASLYLLLQCTRHAHAMTAEQAQRMHDAVDAVCPLVDQEAYLVQQIRLEHQNPARVIALRRLHELGGLLQFTRAELRRERSEHREGLRLFRSFSKKDPDAGFCYVHARVAHGEPD